MSNYTSSYTSDWSAPDAMKRYSMYLTPKGKVPAASWKDSPGALGGQGHCPVHLGPSQHVPPVWMTYDLALCSSGASLLMTQGFPPSLASFLPTPSPAQPRWIWFLPWFLHRPAPQGMETGLLSLRLWAPSLPQALRGGATGVGEDQYLPVLALWEPVAFFGTTIMPIT